MGMEHDDLVVDRAPWGSTDPALPPDPDLEIPDALNPVLNPPSRSAAALDEESRAALGHLFGARVINDGHRMIKLEVPQIVEHGADVPVSVEVNWPMVLAKAVARLYLIADGTRDPLARAALIPDLVPPHVRLTIRLDEATTVRAVVECGDGTLLQAQRWVWVMPPDVQPELY